RGGGGGGGPGGGGAEPAPAGGKRPGRGFKAAQVLRRPAGQRLRDAPRGGRADAGQLGQCFRESALEQFVYGQQGGPGRRGAERAYPVRRLARTLEQERDTP